MRSLLYSVKNHETIIAYFCIASSFHSILSLLSLNLVVFGLGVCVAFSPCSLMS